MTKVMRYTVVVITTLAILLLLWQFGIAIVLFLLSLAVAAALRPLITNLMGSKVSKRLALGIVYSLLVVSIVSFLFFIGPAFLEDLQRASDDFITNYDRAKVEWPQSGSLFQKAMAEQLPPSTDLYQALTSDEGIPALRGIFGIAQNFFSSLGHIAIVIVLSLYWSADQLRFERLGLSFLPSPYHSKALHTWRSIEMGVGAYIRSELVQSILTGLLLWVIYRTLGIPYPTMLAVWGAIVRLIPWFGALIAALPALFIALTSPSVGLMAAISTMVVVVLLKDIIEPRLFHRHKYSSLLIVLLVISLAEAFGFTGVILAPPLTVAIQIMFKQLYPFPTSTLSQEVSETVANARVRLIDVKKRTHNRTRRRSRLLINRIYYLVKRTTDYLQES